ncbi:substrate-binding domain-containing protein [Cohnella thermotolerans]|uniref:substrate-binding domain-containing protein n=1 Tax=Cohnella thermotolerans TaxID=329858 RepID=UPI00040860E8|nr:substrate-binding domain-containing protein [Cohnella thermotolerans]
MKKLLFVYGLLVVTFLAYIWYFVLRDEAPTGWNESAAGLTGEISEKYVMVTFQSSLDYWRTSMKGFEDAAQQLNVSVEFQGATQYDPNEEITVLEKVIARKPAGIAVTAINPEALNPTIDKAVAAGIPIVLFDSGAPKSKAYAFLGTDNYDAGAQAAREMARRLGGRGKVAVVTQPNQLNHQERTRGFEETLQKDYPGMSIAEVADGKGDILVSSQATNRILEAHPDVQGFFATQANGGVGIAEALETLGLAGRKVVIGFDTDKGTLDLVKSGVIDATLAQGTWNMGYWSLLSLFHLHHGIVAAGGGEGSHPIPPYMDTGITIVTRDNVDDYYAK